MTGTIVVQAHAAEEGGALHSVSWIVGILSVAELTFEQVIKG